MNRLRSFFLPMGIFLFCICINISLQAQVPENYYAEASGKSGPQLKTALFHIVKEPKVVSYARLWKAFEKTDSRQVTHRVWDIYSDNKFEFLTNRCGNYKKEGDCYNREHAVPRSWFKQAPPMNSDLFHIYPTDGYVNNRRSNHPFGEVGITYWTSSNGSKVGQNTFGGYTKTVFEPIDEYKGDLARSLFYMATAYEDRVEKWRSDQIGGSKYPAFSQWSLEMLLKWHREDPVSLKEVHRNEEIYKIQKNRNPYIDYPQLVEHVWGKSKDSGFKLEGAMSSHLKKEYSPFERWLHRVKLFFKK